ncbi:hypothetical protein QL285_039265 [Trifolium repens]|nr:hypothetical protein QL285_039265 [Trifolium repens]
MNYHPAGTAGFEGPHRAFLIPEFDYYINFRCSREVLIKTNTGVMADRKTLKSLEPRAAVDQEIINLVVARQNWFVDPDGKKKTFGICQQSLRNLPWKPISRLTT